MPSNALISHIFRSKDPQPTRRRHLIMLAILYVADLLSYKSKIYLHQIWYIKLKRLKVLVIHNSQI